MTKALPAISLFTAILLAQTAEARVLHLYTLDAPPLTMETPDRHGLVGDIVLEAMRRAGFEADLRFIPWRRGQREVESGENLLITPLARTPEREKRYTWIAPIFDLERTFATLDKPIDSIEQAKAENKVILVGMGSAQEELLAASGIDKEHRPAQVIGKNEIEMLTLGRVDAWFNSSAETLWKWKTAGEPGKLIIGKPVAKDTIYLACSKICAADITEAIAKAIQSMHHDGTAKKIIDGYLAH